MALIPRSPKSCSVWKYPNASIAGAEGRDAKITSRNTWAKRCNGGGMPRYRLARAMITKKIKWWRGPVLGLFYCGVIAVHRPPPPNFQQSREWSGEWPYTRRKHERGPQAGKGIEHRGCRGMQYRNIHCTQRIHPPALSKYSITPYHMFNIVCDRWVIVRLIALQSSAAVC